MSGRWQEDVRRMAGGEAEQRKQRKRQINMSKQHQPKPTKTTPNQTKPQQMKLTSNSPQNISH